MGQQAKLSDPLPKCVADPTCGTSTCKKCSSGKSWSCDACCDGCSKVSKGGVGPKAEGSLCDCSQKQNETYPPEPVSPEVNEECFQQNTLRFATSSSWIEWTNGTRLEFPLTKVTEGTYPLVASGRAIPSQRAICAIATMSVVQVLNPHMRMTAHTRLTRGALVIAMARVSKTPILAYRSAQLGRRAIQRLLAFRALVCLEHQA